MKRDVQYFRKPHSVIAVQNDGGSAFVGAIKANVPWEKIDVETEFGLDTVRGLNTLRQPTGDVVVQQIRMHPRSPYLPNDCYCWCLGDWLVIDEDGPRHVTREAFENLYFRTVTETTTTVPTIEEIMP